MEPGLKLVPLTRAFLPKRPLTAIVARVSSCSRARASPSSKREGWETPAGTSPVSATPRRLTLRAGSVTSSHRARSSWQSPARESVGAPSLREALAPAGPSSAQEYPTQSATPVQAASLRTRSRQDASAISLRTMRACSEG